MQRRQFIGLLTYAAAGAALPASAQAPKKALVALVFGIVRESDGPDAGFPPARAFIDELRALGWVEGRTISIERLSLKGDPKLAPALFADLLSRGVDVIALGGARWLHDAALEATKTTPLVT